MIPLRRAADAVAGFAKPLASRPLFLPVFVFVTLAALPRLWAVRYDQGIFWPDEIYQSLEQGHRMAFGYGFVPWEFRDGARSWVFPGMLGVAMKLASWVGFNSGPGVVQAAKGLMVALALAGIAASMILAYRRAGMTAALLAGAFGAGFPSSIVYGSRCMSEMASGPLLVIAALLIDEPKKRGRLIAAGAVASFAIYVRYQNGLIAVGLLLVLLVNRRWRDAVWYTLSATVVGIAGGMLDWLTWNKPFGSFLFYVNFNLIEGKASNWGTEPFGYYAKYLWASTGWLLALVALGLVLAIVRARMLLLLVAFFFVAHCLIPHKELRFIMPIVPLLLTVSAIGLGTGLRWLRARSWRWEQTAWLAWALAMVVDLGLVARAPSETFGKMGYGDGTPKGNDPPWHAEEDPNLILWAASKKRDLCGLMLTGAVPISTGGYSYLHKDVPLLWSSGVWEAKMANYLGMPSSATPPSSDWRRVETHGKFALYKREGTCAAPRFPLNRNL